MSGLKCSLGCPEPRNKIVPRKKLGRSRSYCPWRKGAPSSTDCSRFKIPANMDTNNTEDQQQTTTATTNQGALEDLKNKLNDPGTDFAQRDSEGRSLLHQAILAQAEPQLVKDLSDRVDLALRDDQGQTVLDLLPGEDSAGIREVLEGKVKDLVLAGGEEGQKEAQRLMLAGWSLWTVTEEEAKEKEVDEVWQKLMELKDQVEKFHKAVQDGRQEDVKEQLSGGGQASQLLTAADRTGLLPLHKAVLCRQWEVLKFLISTFTNCLNVTDHMGRTALHLAAAMTQDPGLYETLKEAGADDSLKDRAGKTATDYQQSPDLLPIADILKRLEGTASATSSSSADDAKPADDTATAAGAEGAAPTQQQEEAQEESQKTVQTESLSPTPKRPRNPTPPKEPTKPAEVTPVSMYVSDQAREGRAPPPSTVDGRYVAQHLGTALTMALAEIAEKRPWDPVEYLAQWLYKYRQNLDERDKQKALLEEIRAEEEAANAAEVIKFKRREEEKRIREEDRLRREEEEAARKKKEQEELQRQAKEALLAQKPQLPTVTEEDGEDAMVRERDERGQTELHLLAAQSGADLVAVMNLGYSLADRDADNKTARDIAEEQGLSENVEIIDNYVSNLVEQEKLDAVRQLVLDGYDKLQDVLAKVSTEGLPDTVTDFLTSLPQLQERATAVLKTVSEGGEAAVGEVQKALEGGDKALALAKDAHGRSPLHLALLAGHQDVAKVLVQNAPLSVKARDNLNRTPLHYAAALSEDMVEILKASGADANAKDAKQHTPAFYKDQKEEILQLKSTLTPGTQDPGEISLPVPEIRADDSNDNDGQADDSEGKEQTGQQQQEDGATGEARQTGSSLATTSAEQEEPSN